MAFQDFFVSILLFLLYANICICNFGVTSFAQNSPSSSPVWIVPDETGELVPTIVSPNVGMVRTFFTDVPRDREKDVHFFLYTRDNVDFSEELIIGDKNVLKFSYFNKDIPTKIVIHGFMNSDQFGFPPAAREAFLQSSTRASPVNLVVVEWGRLALAPWYDDAARNTQLVGVKLARFIEFLVTQGTPLEQIHLIGHSLGAHVAGFAGRHLNSNMSLSLSRITALDPALPRFSSATDEHRIDPSDALYVDVIHTAGGTLPYSNDDAGAGRALAFIEPRGHADFYPNGGRSQPGCGVDFLGTCSHNRAYEYYFESILHPKDFKACECDNWSEFKDGICNCASEAYMGEGCSSSSKGLYYLHTNSKKPYYARPRSRSKSSSSLLHPVWTNSFLFGSTMNIR